MPVDQNIYQEPVIIIGAGLSGLTAALELKEKGISFKILEASDKAGGRAQTHITENGTIINTGANWLHGGINNPLKPLLERYDIPYEDDQPKNKTVVTYYNGKRHGSEFRRKISSPFHGKNIVTMLGAITGLRDVAIPDLARGEQSEALKKYQPIWIGTDEPRHSSAIEIMHDPEGPGGLQIKGGVVTLIRKMVEEIGEENIIYNAPVAKITNTDYGAKAETRNGDIYTGKRILFTASAGVLKSGNITFEPPHQKPMHDYLSGLTMGKMSKIVLEMDNDFFDKRPDLKNLHIDLLDGIPVLCHVNGNGQPTIALLIGGDAAGKIEKMPREELSRFIKDKLEIAQELKGYEAHVRGDPIVTSWMDNEYTLGSYSARNTHAKRNNGMQEGNILYAGEAFDTLSPGTLGGAYRSGLNAGQQIAKQLCRSNTRHLA